MFFFFPKPPLSLDDIPKEFRLAASNRANTPIAVIDDQPFKPAGYLPSMGFFLRELGDIKDVAAVAEYGVVICDIMGVGKEFGSQFEGAHLLAEIKTRYPDKYLIAYSGGTFDPVYKRFLDRCDLAIKKGADPAEWAQVLDRAISCIADPVHHWKRLRSIMLDREVALTDILTLEDAYVRGIRSKDNSYLIKAIAKVRRRNSNSKIVENALPIIENALTLYRIFRHV